MGKPTGFMEFQREHLPERDPDARVGDWSDLYEPMPEGKLREQGARCMDCAVPFCQTGMTLNGMASGCPVHNLIPEWNDLVYRGQWKEALDRLHLTNNFPEFTGRACPAPCEASCVAALHDSSVAIKSIERSIVDKGFEEGWIVPRVPKNRTRKTVAVVGSGPAGLACADQLNQAGHSVTVFERHDRIGGLLTYGIPKMKIEQQVVDRRVDLLREEGIVFMTDTEIGSGDEFASLRRRFDAVVLCIGATKPRDLPIPGRHLKGIHYAMEFLHANVKSLLDSNFADGQFISAKGKDVLVIGGGDTATDCVSTALRHQCNRLMQFDMYEKKPSERASDNPWPQWPVVHKSDSGHEEAKAVFGSDPRQFAMITKEFLGDEDGNVTGVRSVQLKMAKDETGQWVREEIPGTEKIWPAQLVLLAIGFSGPEADVLSRMGIATDSRSNIRARYGDYKTNLEGVFAAGDARRGQSLIVWAIHEGREAAKACCEYLAMQKASYIQNQFAERIGGARFGKQTEIYKFEKIKRAKKAAIMSRPDVELIDLGVGEPDGMAYPGVVRVLSEEAEKPENRFYSDNGISEFKEAAGVYLERVFGVNGIDPETEINHVIGTKSALAMLPSVFINPGDRVIMPSPCYPVLGTHTEYLGGSVVYLPISKENHFLPDLHSLSTDALKHAKLLYLNYPNNPTGASATPEFFERVVRFAREHQIIVVHDAAYAALVYDGAKPLSFLSIPGAKEVGVELHSLSKSFNMTGWRIGFIAGNPLVVKAFATVKDNHDSGQFMAIQKAAVYALRHPEITEDFSRKYSRRHALLVDTLNELGFNAVKPGGSFFLYVEAPKAVVGGPVFATAEDFSQFLIKEQSISTVPWDDAGRYVRFSVTFQAKDEADERRVIDEVKRRLSEVQFIF